jgi:N-acetylglucosamine kinase-like BadF-type ATPase
MLAADAFKNARAACLAALVSAGKLPEDVVGVCAGVAGVSHVDRKVEFTSLVQELFPHAHVAVEPDYAIAFTGATGGAPGIVVVAGTGSVAYGEDDNGHSFKTGGYGYLIDDAGSGYGVGRDAIAAVLRAADKTGPSTVLKERVVEALQVEDVAAIVSGVYGGPINRVKIASLSTVVADAADHGSDEVSKAILGRAGSGLAGLAVAIVRELFPNAAVPFPIAMVGSLWKAGNAITVPFIRSIREAAPTAVLAPPKESPLQGALRRAHALVV